MRGARTHLTYANVASSLALALALTTGGAYAANQLAPKSVGARQLRPGAVTADKVRKNAITAPKIKAAAIKQGKVANGAVTAEKIVDGAIATRKLAAGSVTPEKIPNDSLSGEKVDEATLKQVPSAREADFARTAETANPEAFARIDAEGTVFGANSKGIGTANVKQGLEPGIYCVEVPGFVPRGAQVTPEYAANNSVSVFVKLGGTASCAYPKVEVQTYDNGSRQKEPFYFMAYR